MKRASFYRYAAVVGLAAFPAAVLAAPQSFRELVDVFYNLLGSLVPIILSMAVVAFLYGVQKYILAGADEGDIKEGRNMMVYGIIGLFVMFSVWGLVRLVIETFFQGNVPSAPSESIDPGFIPQSIKSI